MFKKIITELKFKAGIYKLRPIVKISKSGLYISNYAIGIEPDGGVRYELTEKEWFYWTYISFPTWSGVDFYSKKFLDDECYYDYFKEVKRKNPETTTSNWKTFYYALFENNEPTKQYIQVTHKPNVYSDNYFESTRQCHYDSFIISNDMEFYKDNEGFRYFRSEIEFAILSISDREGFEKRTIDFKSFKIPNQPEGVYMLEKKLTEFNLK